MKKFTLYVISSFVLCISCQHKDRIDDLKQLQQLQAQQQKAHLEERPELLTQLLADNFMNIDSGNITSPSKEQAQKRFQSYFDSVEFLVWEDIEEPVIRISDDGSIAYIIVHKRVHLKIPQPDGEAVESKTTFAWMEAWEKINGDWKMKAIASTENINKAN